MVTTAMKKRSDFYSTNKFIFLTPALIEQFLNSMKAGGRQMQTIRTYQKSLEDLYDFLPEGKEVTKEILEDWKISLKETGYSDSTINIRLVAVNGLLRYCNAEEFLSSHKRVSSDQSQPEPTRSEYLQLLSAVRSMRNERSYYLIKVFACIGLCVCELDYLTVESLEEGVVQLPDGQEKDIPDCLRDELIQYADHRGIKQGNIFVTASGAPLDRSNISNAIHKLALRSGIDPEKCNPRALNRMYQTTQDELMGKLRPFYLQSYDNLLNTEQTLVAWETG